MKKKVPTKNSTEGVEFFGARSGEEILRKIFRSPTERRISIRRRKETEKENKILIIFKEKRELFNLNIMQTE